MSVHPIPASAADGGAPREDASPAHDLELAALLAAARRTAAGRRLARAFGASADVFALLRPTALRRLADDQPAGPNDPDAWGSLDAHAQAVLARHDRTEVRAIRLELAALRELIAGQAAADRDAGLDWADAGGPDEHFELALARAHARLPIDLDDPRDLGVQRRSAPRARPPRRARRRSAADDLSRWALANPGQFDADDLRCWRIGSPTWLALAGDSSDVDRSSGRSACWSSPALGGGWQLIPVLSLDAIRLVAELGAELERDLRGAVLPERRVGALLERINAHTCTPGRGSAWTRPASSAEELSRELGHPITVRACRATRRDRWGRLAVHRASYTSAGRRPAGPSWRCAWSPFRTRDFTPAAARRRRRARSTARRPSAVMDLGEAVQTAVDAGLPLLLSTEAAGQLKDTVRGSGG